MIIIWIVFGISITIAAVITFWALGSMVFDLAKGIFDSELNIEERVWHLASVSLIVAMAFGFIIMVYIFIQERELGCPILSD